jgi:hypothetical protein
MKVITFIRHYPIIETAVVVGVGIFYFKVWGQVDSREGDTAKRTLGATVVIGQLNGMITASSLTLALIGAINVALLGSANLSVKTNAFWAMIFVFLSIVFSLLTYASMTTYIREYNVALTRHIVILTAISLLVFAIGLMRLIFAVWGYVWP